MFAFNGLLQYGDDFLFFCNSKTACTVRLCHFYKIRAGDFSFGIMLVIEFFLPLAHHTEVSVVNDYVNYRQFVFHTRCKLLYIHLNTAVSRNV